MPGSSAAWVGKILSFCLAAAFLLTARAPAAAAAPGVGAYAPPLALADLGGVARSVDWGDGSAAATVVFFFDPQSSASLLEMSFVDSLYLRARDYGLAVYAVEARGRQPAEVSRSMERYTAVYRDPSFPLLPDPSFRAGRTYGVEAPPVTFVMESHGVILNRIDGYDKRASVTIVRRLEQLLRLESGFFATALREAGVSEAEELEIGEQIATALAARTSAPSARGRAAGDRVPALEFTDTAGRTTRWTWSSEAAQELRIVSFFAGLTLTSIEELNWLNSIALRGRDSGLAVLAVEVGGMDAAALEAALDRYRRFNPDPSFPVVPDPDGKLARAFGPWEQLPQTYLLAGDGTVVYHAEGFSAGVAEILTGKVERAYLQAGRSFPSARAVGDAAPTLVEEEAPSIRESQQKDRLFRSSLVLGDAAFMAWEFDTALTHYSAALEVQPRDLHSLVRTAQIYERRGEPGAALEFWERVLGVQPDHAEAARRVRALKQAR